jgi:hypothetical protein
MEDRRCADGVNAGREHALKGWSARVGKIRCDITGKATSKEYRAQRPAH